MTRRTRKNLSNEREGYYVAAPKVIFAAILFCLVFAGIGLFTFTPSLAPWFWKSVPCEVLEFRIEDNSEAKLPFAAKVRYRFEWRGSIHESTRVGIDGWKYASTPLALARRFGEARQTRCYLPQGLAENAVLLRPPPKWGSLAFVGFGTCVGWILIQAHRSRNLPGSEVSRRIMPVVALFFGAPGIVLTAGLSLPVWVGSIRAGNWTETPATVVWSTVRTTRGSKSTNYRADICYEYRAAGKTWRNNQIGPGDASGFTSSSDSDLVSAYPPGLETRCFVDPARPENAVLLASPGWAIFLTLFPLPFLAIGLLCAREAFRSGT